MKVVWRNSIVLLSFLLCWYGFTLVCHLPAYILPAPQQVFLVWYKHFFLILQEAQITLLETIIGLVLGIVFGSFAAIVMVFFRYLRFWLLPLLIISQAIPTFAIAPLLVIWLGYGMASKIAATIIMVFFPVTSALYDGLQNTAQEWQEIAKLMRAKKWRFFCFIRIPAALPHFAAGLRIAAVIAPIGAVVGEWVGASQGLGFLMLNSNARMQIDLMFAALFTLVIFSLCLYFMVDRLLHLLIPWEKT